MHLDLAARPCGVAFYIYKPNSCMEDGWQRDV